MIRNCLGLTLADLKNDLFSHLDNWLLNWLLDLQCGGGGAGEAALANFDAFSVFTAKQSLNHLNNLDANNGMINGSDVYGFLRDNAQGYLDDFATRECSGRNNSINDLVRTYKPDPWVGMYPNTISDSKKELLLSNLRDSNFNSAVRNRLNPSPGNSIPYIILDDSDRGDDMTFIPTSNLFGDPILSKIPVSVVDSFDPDKTIYTKCFKTIFTLDSYIVPDNRDSRPIVTDYKLQNLRRLHSEILLPIYRFYYGSENDASCKMRIHGGLTSMLTSVSKLTSSMATRHIHGQAVNFSLVSISNEDVINDISSGAIGVDYGVCALVNGIFITVPYTYENYQIRGVTLSSPNFDSDDIRMKFG